MNKQPIEKEKMHKGNLAVAEDERKDEEEASD
jgi:hypothetical protein